MKKNRRSALKVGDRVEILTTIAPLKHQKNKNGIIVYVNGAYIDVRPMWCKWITECYPNELRKLQ